MGLLFFPTMRTAQKTTPPTILRQSQNYITIDGQPGCLGVKYSIWDLRPTFFLSLFLDIYGFVYVEHSL
jgi:hypothetical protein